MKHRSEVHLRYTIELYVCDAGRAQPEFLTFVPTDFASPSSPGNFSPSRSADRRDVILTFTEVPEPGTLALSGIAAIA
jgi:hypothetical protein